MGSVTRGQFAAIWRIAIILCAILALFTAFFSSCTKAPSTPAPAEAGPAEDTVPADTDAPAALIMTPPEQSGESVSPDADDSGDGTGAPADDSGDGTGAPADDSGNGTDAPADDSVSEDGG